MQPPQLPSLVKQAYIFCAFLKYGVYFIFSYETMHIYKKKVIVNKLNKKIKYIISSKRQKKKKIHHLICRYVKLNWIRPRLFLPHYLTSCLILVPTTYMYVVFACNNIYIGPPLFPVVHQLHVDHIYCMYHVYYIWIRNLVTLQHKVIVGPHVSMHCGEPVPYVHPDSCIDSFFARTHRILYNTVERCTEVQLLHSPRPDQISSPVRWWWQSVDVKLHWWIIAFLI